MINYETTVRRLSAIVRRATPAQRAAGVAWYDEARFFVDSVQYAHPRYTREQIAGVVAVTSPGVRWVVNKRATLSYVESHEAGIPVDEWDYKLRIGENMKKADRVLNGDLSAISGPKVLAFYANLMDNESMVTVDRWHAFAADPTRDRDSNVGVRERRVIERATAYVAAVNGLTPAACQAVVWVVIRDAVTRTGVADKLGA